MYMLSNYPVIITWEGAPPFGCGIRRSKLSVCNAYIRSQIAILFNPIRSAQMEFISRGDVLKLFDISVWTLRRWQKNNNFPGPIPASGKVRMYRKPAVEAWLEAQAEQHKLVNSK